MSIPSISTLPPAPNRNDPANFSDIADVFVAALPVFETETNAAIDAMNLDLADASTNITAALATANYVGLWNVQTGALNTPASVDHDGTIWVLKTNLADVTLSEPGVTTDWTAFGISSAIVSTNSEINKLSGVTTNTAQLNYLNTLSSNVQTQLDGKAASIHTHTSAQISDATSANTSSRIVIRDGSGNFSAGTITAALTGNASSATKLANTRNIALAGDCSGSVNFDGTSNVSITVVVANNSHSHTSTNISDATSANTANRIVERDGSGNFSAGTITATLNGNASSATTAAACSGNAATASWATDAGKVDGQSFAWNNSSNSPTYLWAANSNGSAFLCARGSMSVNYSTTSGTAAAASTVSNANSSQSGDGWWRSSGAHGWYSTTYGGGIYMTDTTYVRTYGTKQLYVSNQIKSTSNITAYFSDMRLKTKTRGIENALAKVCTLDGFFYKHNDLGQSFGFKKDGEHLGLSAQQVQAIVPEAVTLAPFDEAVDEFDEDKTWSKSGENYMTLDYGRLVPILVEAIKEQQLEIEKLKTVLNI